MGDETKLLNLGQFYIDSKYILDSIINSLGTNMLDKLSESLNNMADNYHGKDSEIQINTLIVLYNELIDIENDLALISVGLSKIARNYRNVQLAFGVNKDKMLVFKYENQGKLSDHIDKRDTIDISGEVMVTYNNMTEIQKLIELYDEEIKTYRLKICENWLMGKGHDKMEFLFDRIIGKVEKYKEKLIEGTNKVKIAIDNYNF